MHFISRRVKIRNIFQLDSSNAQKCKQLPFSQKIRLLGQRKGRVAKATWWVWVNIRGISFSLWKLQRKFSHFSNGIGMGIGFGVLGRGMEMKGWLYGMYMNILRHFNRFILLTLAKCAFDGRDAIWRPLSHRSRNRMCPFALRGIYAIAPEYHIPFWDY